MDEQTLDAAAVRAQIVEVDGLIGEARAFDPALASTLALRQQFRLGRHRRLGQRGCGRAADDPRNDGDAPMNTRIATGIVGARPQACIPHHGLVSRIHAVQSPRSLE